MKDRRPVDELTLEELEEALRVRRRQERLKRMTHKARPTDPLRSAPPPVIDPLAHWAQAPVGVANRYSAVVEPPGRSARRPIRWGWVWDKFLLLIELVALLGFILLALRLFSTVRAINEDSRAAQRQPTPSPTPLIQAAVLPGGHTPPDAQRHSEPAPIPAHLRSLVAAITPLPPPTPGPEQAQRIVIPAIGVDAPVVEGDDWESLKKGAAHHIGSANPGERGNCVLSAHNDIYGEIFRYLPEMKVGDEIFVHTQAQKYRYVVEQTRIINEDEVGVMASTSTPVLTLISCYPYRVDTHRIVVIAALKP